MITFFVCLALLLIGYATYGAFVEKVFHPDDRETPCTRLEDGVDYAPIAPWRAFLIQLLNIAGLGPKFSELCQALSGVRALCFGSYLVPFSQVLSTIS